MKGIQECFKYLSSSVGNIVIHARLSQSDNEIIINSKLFSFLKDTNFDFQFYYNNYNVVNNNPHLELYSNFDYKIFYSEIEDYYILKTPDGKNVLLTRDYDFEEEVYKNREFNYRLYNTETNTILEDKYGNCFEWDLFYVNPDKCIINNSVVELNVNSNGYNYFLETSFDKVGILISQNSRIYKLIRNNVILYTITLTLQNNIPTFLECKNNNNELIYRYSFDINDNFVKIKDEITYHSIKYIYNTAGNHRKISQIVENFYDNLSNVDYEYTTNVVYGSYNGYYPVEITLFNGRKHFYYLDDEDRLVLEKNEEGQFVSREYNSCNAVSLHSNPIYYKNNTYQLLTTDTSHNYIQSSNSNSNTNTILDGINTEIKYFNNSIGYYEARGNIKLDSSEYISICFFANSLYPAILKVDVILIGETQKTITKNIECDSYFRFYVFDVKLDFAISSIRVKIKHLSNLALSDEEISYQVSTTFAYNINSINKYVYDSENNLLYIENKSTNLFSYNDKNYLVSSPGVKNINLDEETDRINNIIDSNDTKINYLYLEDSKVPIEIEKKYSNSIFLERKEYNSFAQPIAVTDNNNYTSEISYDLNYRINRIENSDGTVTTINYNKEKISQLMHSSGVDYYRINYQYDRDVLTNIVYNSFGYEFLYNNGLELNSVMFGPISTPSINVQCTYEMIDDKKTSILHSYTFNNVTHVYVYDEKYENIISVLDDENTIISEYEYDDNYNLSSSYNANSNNSYTYDVNNRIIKEEVKIDNVLVQTNEFVYCNGNINEKTKINNKKIVNSYQNINSKMLYNNNNFYNKIKLTDYYSCFFNEYKESLLVADLTRADKNEYLNCANLNQELFNKSINAVTFDELSSVDRLVYKVTNVDFGVNGMFIGFTFNLYDIASNDNKILFSYGCALNDRIQLRVSGDGIFMEIFVGGSIINSTHVAKISQNEYYTFGLNVYKYTINNQNKLYFDVDFSNIDFPFTVVTNDYTTELKLNEENYLSFGGAVNSNSIFVNGSVFFGSIGNIVYGRKADDEFFKYYLVNSNNLINLKRTSQFNQNNVGRIINYSEILDYGKLYPLNGDFVSLDGDKPISSNLRQLEDKRLAFIYDDSLKRNVYNLRLMSVKYSVPALKGTAIIKYKPTVNQTYDKVVFNFGYNSYVFVCNDNSIYLNIDGYGIPLNLSVNHNEWNDIAFSYDLHFDEEYYCYFGKVKLWCNGQEIENDVEMYGLFDTLLLGESYNAEEQSYGMMEDLFITNMYMSNEKILSYLNSNHKTIKNNEYGDDERLCKEEILENNAIVSTKTYNYHTYNYNGKTYDTYLVKDVICSNNSDDEETRMDTKYSYTYFDNGLIETIKENNVVSKTYNYDYQNRLVSCIDSKNGRTYTYTYDNNSNLLSINQSFGGTTEKQTSFTISQTELNRLDKMVVNGVDYNFSYVNGILNKVTYNQNGRVKNINYTFTNNRLSSLSDSTGFNTYKYDSLGRLIEKNEDDLDITKYYYVDNKLVTRIKNNLERIDYLYDSTNVVYGFRYNDNNYYYDRDLTGIINGIYCTNGSKVVEYIYDPYGRVLDIIDTSQISLGTKNEIVYKGYLYDRHKEVYYCNSRVYSPVYLRWLSMDDIEYLDQNSISGLNLYCYCNSNPVNYYDPTGHFPWLVLAIISGVLIVGGATLGGVSAYQSGRDVGTGILEGAFTGAMMAGSMWLMVGSFYVPNGLSSNLGLMMFTYGFNTMAGMTEAGATQIRYSISQGEHWSSNLTRSLATNAPSIYITKAIPKMLPFATQFTWHIGEKYAYTIPGEGGVFYDYRTTKDAWGMFKNYLGKTPTLFSYGFATYGILQSLRGTYNSIFGTPNYDNWIVY